MKFWQFFKRVRVKMYKTAYAYVQGRSHSEKNIPCQDRVMSLTGKGVTVLSLADGAGSAKHSDIGAEIAVTEINQWLSELFKDLYKMNEEDLKWLLSEVILESLEKEATQRKIAFKELSSTLLFVAVDSSKYLAGHLGDGIIGYMCSEGVETTIKVLSYPAKGEYHNSTFFTTASNLQEHLRIYKGSMNNVEGFILMSDGAEESLFDRREKQFAPAVQRFFDWLNDHSEEEVNQALFKNLEKHICLKTQDDCSVGILRRIKN